MKDVVLKCLSAQQNAIAELFNELDEDESVDMEDLGAFSSILEDLSEVDIRLTEIVKEVGLLNG